ncbi:probable G-protein coupled receptor 141 [Scomber scombrus]|uniref:Probable G-protein coupled receptor 141 n=1 Tax=Scomber scombrus TaxID=13677 RepID=A0AAV1MYE6_SCOSC|nr:probable G-protein coupled receptor 141 [Scomber scombrus]
MTSTTTQSTTMAMNSVMTSHSLSTGMVGHNGEQEYCPVLVAIYSVVLLIGTISLSFMMHILKSSTTSITSIAVLNLIFTHFVFLLTVPFRIYYFANLKWELGRPWCRVVSGMIHIHMYMSFIFYVIILITRLMSFYNKGGQMASIQRLHALLGSAILWIVVLVMVPCIMYYSYGKNPNEERNSTRCFDFATSIVNHNGAIVVNYIISVFIIIVAIVLTALQANVLRVLYRKHRQGCTSQQDFGAQQKSLFFALIMVISLIPYHLFRIYYLNNLKHLQSLNEVFLSLTTFNCLDTLTFLGRRTCLRCFPRQAI